VLPEPFRPLGESMHRGKAGNDCCDYENDDIANALVYLLVPS